MRQALTSPVFGSLVVGGLLLAIAASQVGGSEPRTRRLVLHAPEQCGAFYLTAWRDGDVTVRADDDALEPLTFQTRARVSDGCQWLATETLVPVGPARYAYRYDEQVVRCRPGAKPFWKTPRTGYVDVVEE